MENAKRNSAKIALAILAILLVTSTLVVFSNSAGTTTAAAADYGDVTQYECPQLGQDESNTRFSAGPAPNNPDLLWSAPGTIWAVFHGKAFAIAGGFLYALDAFTGTQQWRTNLTAGGGGSYVTELDDKYLLVDASAGLACYRVDNGQLVWYVPTDFATKNIPASGNYFPGKYSSELKMKYILNYSRTTKEAKILAYNLSNPSVAPPIAWEYVTDESAEVLAAGGGKVFVGGYSSYSMYAFDGKNGTLLWKSPKIGLPAYSATYVDGKLYHAGGSTRLTCYDGDTGEILWDYDAGAGRAFFAYGGAAAYGRYYEHNIDPFGGFIGCWDAETGDVLWKAERAFYQLGYFTPVVADGKVYVTRSDGWSGAGRVADPSAFTCYDAFTGAKLWELPFTVTHPIVAYGNLYAGVYCIGSPTPPQPWSWFRGNTDNHGVAKGQSAPRKLDVKWAYKTDGAVISSPAIVDGKVYVGSTDQNLYCLDAYTGNFIWKFPTEYRIASSPAVSGGKVFTGADDGYIYCIDAETGTEIWNKNLYGGNVPPYLWEVATWQARSSPLVVGDKLYVGALDGKVYCLGTADGSVKWMYPTNGPIGGSPAYSNGVIYIASTDRNLYALDAATGTKKWTWTTPITFDRMQPPFGWVNATVFGKSALFLVSTPTVAEGKLFIGAGAAYSGAMVASSIMFVALNVTTGTQLWNVTLPPAANNAPVWTPTYFKGVLYAPRWMSMAAYNTTNGALLWDQWLGHQVFSSPAYADDLSGAKVYVGCDSYSITAFNATSGKVLSVYGTDGQVVGSPAIYDGKLYAGSVDHYIYCFDDSPIVCTSIWAEANKGEQMWSNETITISGQLRAAVNYTSPDEVTQLFYPGLPNATVILSINKPDLSSVNLTATTDNMGHFTASYGPTQAGNWGWVAYYEGQQLPYVTYSAAYTEWNAFEVTSPPSGGGTSTPTPTPTPATGMPVEYIYAAVAIIAIVLIAIGAYAYTRRSKK